MRDSSQWSKPLREALRKSLDLKAYLEQSLPDADTNIQQREIVRLAQLIAEVELGLTSLMEVAPEERATSVSALLLGYRFPVKALESEENWLLVQKARFYLVRRKGRQWERTLTEYIKLPENLRIFSLTDINDVPQLIPSSTYPQRLQLYRQTLSKTPPHKKQKVKLATSGYWYAKVSDQEHTTVDVPINIPEAVANLAPSPQISFHSTRTAVNPSRLVTFEKLLQDAQEMDEKLAQAEYEPENYHQRLTGIALKLYDASIDDFQPSLPNTEIKLDQLIHIVGLLNVGKSTLLEILIYHFAKQGYRCALLVNDIVAAVRLASLFREKLGILASPVLGSDRFQHLEKVYEPILATKGDEMETGAIHPAWRWFSPVCPLLALVQSEAKWEFGEEPCHNLYQKQTTTKNGNSQAKDDEDFDEGDTEDKYTCPLYYKCPRHQLERDIATALVWVLTPASFIHTRVPPQVLAKKLTFAEAVYRECDFLFVDEADRVQVQFDEACAPDEVLVNSSGNSLLNQLGLKFATTIYNSDRRSMGAELVSTAKRANDYAQIATDLILPRLHNQPKLVEWVGPNPFTGRSLFAHIIRDILDKPKTEEDKPSPKLKRAERSKERQKRISAGLPPEEERQRRKKIMETLEGFLQAPLNRRKGGELSDLAFSLLSAENDERALTKVAEWLRKWLELLGISLTEKTKFEEVTLHLHLAILVTVLNDKLGFLVDNLNALMRAPVIDLHDTSLALVYRPPSDYLPVVPSSPVGNILGFRYTRDRSHKTGGKLEYFRYVGVGRYLLLNFPHLFAVDGWDGPHTVLISGTSYAPGTPAYHIRKKPTILLEPATNNNTAGDAGISESDFCFSSQRNAVGKYIALSGLPPAMRKTAANEMVKAICHSPGQATSFLTELFETLKVQEQKDPQRWGDRQRLLLIINSYDEAELVESILKPLYRNVENLNGIATLRRDNAPAHLSGIRRGQIRDLAQMSTTIVVAPLMALERGHNILNENRIAAFGAAVFLSRPMPVPDDWQTTVQQLNNWALENSSNFRLYDSLQKRGDALTLTNVENEFYQYAVAKMLDLNCRAMSFKQLTSDERSILCWTQLVSVWQIIGRLVRGGVPCIVHFLDAKFAPKSVDSELDNEVTSLLVAMIKELQLAIEPEDKQPWEKTLAKSLYGAFFNALKQTKDLRYDL
ncbi:pPIWI_RE_Z domain-containing protein [Umezakia ovalisporum]|uniref:pPIWI_RE_Z domain-containing protein n=1 Tax=Umezakia ovalisporum TaxID=75695 RepID=UPI0035B725DA